MVKKNENKKVVKVTIKNILSIVGLIFIVIILWLLLNIYLVSIWESNPIAVAIGVSMMGAAAFWIITEFYRQFYGWGREAEDKIDKLQSDINEIKSKLNYLTKAGKKQK